MGKARRKRVKAYNMRRKGKLIHINSYLRKRRAKKG